MSDRKVCKKCKHCKGRGYISFKCTKWFEIDPINGKKLYWSCFHQRLDDDGKCGLNGKYFEQKESWIDRWLRKRS